LSSLDIVHYKEEMAYGSIHDPMSFPNEINHIQEKRQTKIYSQLKIMAALGCAFVVGFLLFSGDRSASKPSQSGKFEFNKDHVEVIEKIETSSPVFVTKKISTPPHSYTDKGSLKSVKDWSVSVTNEYSYKNLAMFPYSFLKDSLLMEPYRESTVTVDGISSTCSNTWILQGQGQLSTVTYGGQIDSSNSFVAMPLKTGQYLLSISSSCDAESTLEWKSKVMVKYVRRELRSLNDHDREEFLDAFRTLWDVNTLDGQKKYGPAYKSLYYFATIHNDAGSYAQCDNFHKNSGFINNHIFLGAFLEQSLQLVNPRTALHYWEYSIDFSSKNLYAHTMNMLDGGSWTDIMTSKYFGKSDPFTGEIIDGRWNSTKMPRATKDFFHQQGVDFETSFFPLEYLDGQLIHTTSPYGLLRAPWNFHPGEYTVRYNNPSRCYIYLFCVFIILQYNTVPTVAFY
jgi:hypothetical protein